MVYFERARSALVASALGLALSACGAQSTPAAHGTNGPSGGAGGTSSASGGSTAGGSPGAAGSNPGTSGGSAATSTGGTGGTGPSTTTTAGSAGAGGSGDIDGGATDGSGGAGGSGGAAAGGRADGGTGGTPLNDGGTGLSACPATGLGGAGHVQISRSGTSFTMTRDGVPYYIKGIDGAANLDLAQRSGVNSSRTFTSDGAMALLDTAASHCMTVLLGIDLSNMPADYTNATFLAAKRAEVTNLLATVKTHPALLMWAIGNEIQLAAGNDNQTTVGFVQELAQTIHQQDPNHPVITAVAGANSTFLNHLVQWAPALDAVGINTYAAVGTVNADVGRSMYTGPFFVTEWGPTGWWEAPTTTWGRPLEQTSGDKGRVYASRYMMFAHTGRVLGDYVFLWGQKIESTPTWFGMFLETNADLGIAGESLPTVDTMAFEWSGVHPSNRAPDVTALTLGGKAATANVTLTAGQTVPAVVTVTEPDGDTMSYVWEILQDPTEATSNMG
ncbi:MAG TPA: hypothetical protein VGY54_04030, partial [Polyangiaceae bacterium]|nr:hypothetical protein [Polyangiaceae bacterium]